MPTMREEPLFNLKAVVQQTGLKPDTLRAWERRYGLPNPERSGGGHRLYSQRDIRIIKWLMARQDEGLSISRAVEMWQQIEAEGRNPLQVATPLLTAAAPVPAPRPSGETLAELRESWIEACLCYDETRAEQIVNQAFALYSPETVAIELLQRAMAQVGEGWYQGDVTVQQEHFCSALVQRRLEALIMAAPPPTRPGHILAACPPDEYHVFGPLLLTLLLRRRGWEVIYLGANVPIQRMETTIAATQPQLVILAAQRLQTAATLLNAAHSLEREAVPLAYGGLIFNLLPDLRRRIPGHFLGEQLETAPQVLEALLVAPPPLPRTPAIPEPYPQARDHFQRREGLIEAQLGQALDRPELPTHRLTMVSRELALNIDAALALGSMDLLDYDLDWVQGLIQNHGLPPQALDGYLRAYRDAAGQHLDERGAPILDWLDKLLDRSQSARIS
jgi:DNA-binding transcriptional MerR regulator